MSYFLSHLRIKRILTWKENFWQKDPKNSRTFCTQAHCVFHVVQLTNRIISVIVAAKLGFAGKEPIHKTFHSVWQIRLEKKIDMFLFDNQYSKWLSRKVAIKCTLIFLTLMHIPRTEKFCGRHFVIGILQVPWFIDRLLISWT